MIFVLDTFRTRLVRTGSFVGCFAWAACERPGVTVTAKAQHVHEKYVHRPPSWMLLLDTHWISPIDMDMQPRRPPYEVRRTNHRFNCIDSGVFFGATIRKQLPFPRTDELWQISMKQRLDLRKDDFGGGSACSWATPTHRSPWVCWSASEVLGLSLSLLAGMLGLIFRRGMVDDIGWPCLTKMVGLSPSHQSHLLSSQMAHCVQVRAWMQVLGGGSGWWIVCASNKPSTSLSRIPMWRRWWKAAGISSWESSTIYGRLQISIYEEFGEMSSESPTLPRPSIYGTVTHMYPMKMTPMYV